MLSFFTSSLKGKSLYIIIISLSLTLTFFYLKNENLESKLETQKLSSSLWKENSMSSQNTIDSLLTHQVAMNKVQVELEITKTALRNKTSNDKKKLMEYMNNDEKTKIWAKNEIPKNIQKLLTSTQ